VNIAAPLHERVRSVTERIRARSAGSRAAYLERSQQSGPSQAGRSMLSCTNLAHGFAAMETAEKERLRSARWANLAIVSSYNDMLSAHRPFERFPELIKLAAREAGAVAQFAGGVPAMCDGVTQGQPGMELSLFSRDVIAMGTAVALTHNMFDSAFATRSCRAC
jgi:phosphogluconate dehydratase